MPLKGLYTMCRLLGMISVEANSAEFHLLNSECSLFNQAVKGKQSDGWGIGFYSGNTPLVIKSEKAVYEDKPKFEEAAEKARSRIIIAHVRKASNPRGLSREMLISLENSQPFTYSNYMLAHNGSINIPDEVIKRMGSYADLIKGCNDSEVYFYLLLSLIEGEGDVIAAFRRVEPTLNEIFNEERVTRFESPFTSLNAIFSDGEKLYAFTRYLVNPGRSICYGDAPIYEMCYSAYAHRLIIASEKTCKEKWFQLANNHLLVCWVDGGKICYNHLDLTRSIIVRDSEFREEPDNE